MQFFEKNEDCSQTIENIGNYCVNEGDGIIGEKSYYLSHSICVLKLYNGMCTERYIIM